MHRDRAELARESDWCRLPILSVSVSDSYNRCNDGEYTSKFHNHGAQDCASNIDKDKLDMTSAP